MLTVRAVSWYGVYSVFLLTVVASLAAAGDGTDHARTPRDRRITFDMTPVRGEPQALELERAGFTYSCKECHRDLKAPADRANLEAEHGTIVFNHGTDMSCQVCHHPDNRDAYVDRECRQIPSTNTVELCAKCHNIEYRDWKANIHGRVNGYWNPALGPQTRLLCVQCHDRRAPAFQTMKPLPPPRKTRMPFLLKGPPHE